MSTSPIKHLTFSAALTLIDLSIFSILHICCQYLTSHFRIIIIVSVDNLQEKRRMTSQHGVPCKVSLFWVEINSLSKQVRVSLHTWSLRNGLSWLGRVYVKRFIWELCGSKQTCSRREAEQIGRRSFSWSSREEKAGLKLQIVNTIFSPSKLCVKQ